MIEQSIFTIDKYNKFPRSIESLTMFQSRLQIVIYRLSSIAMNIVLLYRIKIPKKKNISKPEKNDAY